MKVFRTTPIIIQLDEGKTKFEEVPQRVQLMRTCTFFHPRYGKVEITRQLFSEMIQNFQNKVRGIELMIDYAHDSDREAAGWIKNVEIVENPDTQEAELWADVEWTPEGRRTLADREFAYLSADFDPNYQDNEAPDKKFGAVLLGAGLTNRPVIKKMNPAIQLSEFNQSKENIMQNQEQTPAPAANADMEKKLGQVNKLMEDLGVDSIEALMQAIAELKKNNTEMMEEKQLSEKKTKLTKLFSEGKINKAQMDKALELKGEQFTGFITLAEMSQGTVKTEEEGSNQTPPKAEGEVDPEDKVIELAEKLVTEKKLGMDVAIKTVLSENADLRSAYYKKQDQE